MKTLAKDTIVANARFFGNDLSKVPTMTLTVGVGTVMDAREVYCIFANKPRCGHTCSTQLFGHSYTKCLRNAVQERLDVFVDSLSDT